MFQKWLFIENDVCFPILKIHLNVLWVIMIKMIKSFVLPRSRRDGALVVTMGSGSLADSLTFPMAAPKRADEGPAFRLSRPSLRRSLSRSLSPPENYLLQKEENMG